MKIFKVIFVFLFAIEANAQYDFVWERTNNGGGDRVMNSNNISGDFGRRECCTNKWHDGLDVPARGLLMEVLEVLQ